MKTLDRDNKERVAYHVSVLFEMDANKRFSGAIALGGYSRVLAQCKDRITEVRIAWGDLALPDAKRSIQPPSTALTA